MCKPFLKRAGGKRQLVEKLLRSRPKQYNRYIEPFIGGGALFFALKPKNAYISDINEQLINIYRVVEEDVGALIAELRKHERNYREGVPSHLPQQDLLQRTLSSELQEAVQRAVRVLCEPNHRG